MLTILMGKSASGKDTLLKKLVEENGFIPLVSATTRPMREGEVDGVDYNFLSKEEFGKLLMDGKFLESRSYNTTFNGKKDKWWYGSPAVKLDPNKNYVKVLDVDGTNSFIEHYGRENCFVVNIKATDKTREYRAVSRGSFSKEEWNRRLRDDEIKFSDERVSAITNYTLYNDTEYGLDVAKEYLLTAYEGYCRKEREKGEQYTCRFFEDYDTGDPYLFVASVSELQKSVEQSLKKETKDKGSER